MLHQSACVSTALLGCCAALLGCHRAPRSERYAAAPPYRVDAAHPQQLVVRDDLLAALETKPVSSSNVQATLVGYGRVAFAPDASYAVRVPYVSFVDKVLVSVGDAVSPGKPLAELRSSDVARLRAEVANLVVAVDSERRQVERVERLVVDGTANEREVSEARARLQSAETQVAGARAALTAAAIDPGVGDRYVLRASAAGRVLTRSTDPGDRVAPEDALPALLIGNPTRLVVTASFPERDAVWLQEGAPCSFTVSAVTGDAYAGEIVQIVRAVDPRTRTATATCAMSKQDPRLASEMSARVEVSIDRDARVTVPRSAVLLGNDQYVVFVKVGANVLERRHVELGLSIGDQVQIAKGVSGGEAVVTRGAVLLEGELDRLL